MRKSHWWIKYQKCKDQTNIMNFPFHLRLQVLILYLDLGILFIKDYLPFILIFTTIALLGFLELFWILHPHLPHPMPCFLIPGWISESSGKL